jgi:hypothetical protein
MSYFDLRDSNFEQFVDFLFNHDVEYPEPWYFDIDLEVDYDPERHAQFYMRLFSDPTFLFEKYSRGQLEQGFWVIPGCNVPGAVSEIIWDERISFEQRAACVKSMFILYREFFSKDPLHTSCNMWWDSLCYDYCCGNKDKVLSDEQRKMQDVMFETLSQILDLDREECQGAALHGLGHLRHPDTESLIRAWIAKHPELSEDELNYAEGCIRGDIM